MQKPISVRYISSNNGLQQMQMIIFFIVIFCGGKYIVQNNELSRQAYLPPNPSSVLFSSTLQLRCGNTAFPLPVRSYNVLCVRFFFYYLGGCRGRRRRKKSEADLCRCPRRRQVVHSAALWQMSCVRDNFAGRRAGLKGEDDLGGCLWLCAVANAAGDIWKELLH